MKRRYFGTNMKMYKTTADTKFFLNQILSLLGDFLSDNLTMFVIPSFTSLEAAAELLSESPVLLGAQNMHWAEEGQFSGEISAKMLKDLGVSLVMLGHSERRHVFGESDEELNKKVLTTIRHRLIPLLCIGETAEEKAAGISDEILRIQLKRDLYGFPRNALSSLLIAYEPVWSIGVSGIPATPTYVAARHAAIRACLTEKFGVAGASVPLLFGGSVNPQNAPGYLAISDVDGLFVGRSAWDGKNYCEMVKRLFT